MSKISIVFKDLLNDENSSEESLLLKSLIPKLELLTPPILDVETLLSKDPKKLYNLIPCSLNEALSIHQLAASLMLKNSNNFDINENIPNLLSWKNFQNAYEPTKNISKHRPSGFIQLDHLLTSEQGNLFNICKFYNFQSYYIYMKIRFSTIKCYRNNWIIWIRKDTIGNIII
jgi:hypothetical protein